MIVRTYDNLWKVDKRLYRVGDYSLSRPPLYSQLAFFLVGEIITVAILAVLGQINYDGLLIKYLGAPLGFCMFMSKVKFDGKRPDRYFLSLLRFYLSPHLLRRYEAVEVSTNYTWKGKIKQVIEMENMEKGKRKKIEKKRKKRKIEEDIPKEMEVS